MLGPIVLAFAWFGGLAWTALVLGGAIIATREALRIVRAADRDSNLLLGTLIALAIVVPAGMGPNSTYPHLLPLLGLPYAVLLSFIAQIQRPAEMRSLDDWSRTLAVSLYVCGMAAFLVGLRELPEGRTWITALLLLIWTNDSFAYLGGRQFGRRPMAAVLSPKKTWEGFAIAAVACFLAALAAAFLLGPELLSMPRPRLALPLLALIVSTAGPLGDLSVSFLKRQTGVKDSGHLIPGHGGVLDRTDSLLFAAPLVYSLAVMLSAV